ncbi:HD domain-containing protein [Photobacterium kishitanii]|uniref:HD domain-containing protein n=1 Tax=Photobacterium kishitanii TaxID=318456 RepID=A0A2T3KLJ7_9GAMM|nr:HD domain-containing protein [Photobacterium kishitanii]PSV00595.1 hypothetical protein C9J27_05520 [Photobacterium kishitanii]
MTEYLVGNVPRDLLLNQPPKTKHFVVIGESTESMVKKGFKKDDPKFPTFLHPVTSERYSLAVRKVYKRAFDTANEQSTQNATLEDDLERRGLTINSIAMDLNGEIIDPFKGVEDIKAKVLRHTSTCFSEDPLQIVRLSRYYARYKHSGFTIAEETRLLVKSMVREGVIKKLSAGVIINEMMRAFDEDHPRIFFETLADFGALKYIFPELDSLRFAEQWIKYHPEGNAFEHSMQVLEAAKELGANHDQLFAALMHDIGKGNTPADILPKHTGHESRGVKLLEALFNRFTLSKKTMHLSKIIAKNHMLMHSITELKASSLLTLLDDLKAFKQEDSTLDSFILITRADECGRNNLNTIRDYNANEEYLRFAFQKANKITLDIVRFRFNCDGKKAADKLKKMRIEVLSKFRENWNFAMETNKKLKNAGLDARLEYQPKNNSISIKSNGTKLAAASMNQCKELCIGLLAGVNITSQAACKALQGDKE